MRTNSTKTFLVALGSVSSLSPWRAATKCLYSRQEGRDLHWNDDLVAVRGWNRAICHLRLYCDSREPANLEVRGKRAIYSSCSCIQKSSRPALPESLSTWHLNTKTYGMYSVQSPARLPWRQNAYSKFGATAGHGGNTAAYDQSSPNYTCKCVLVSFTFVCRSS